MHVCVCVCDLLIFIVRLFLVDRGETLSRPLPELICISDCDNIMLTDAPLAKQFMLAGLHAACSSTSWSVDVMKCIQEAGPCVAGNWGVCVLAEDVEDNSVGLYHRRSTGELVSGRAGAVLCMSDCTYDRWI